MSILPRTILPEILARNTATNIIKAYLREVTVIAKAARPNIRDIVYDITLICQVENPATDNRRA
jgi:hypothetical protein